MRRYVTIYQVWNAMDAGATDWFVRNKREAEQMAAEIRRDDPEHAQPEIRRHKIALDKDGICWALTILPNR